MVLVFFALVIELQSNCVQTDSNQVMRVPNVRSVSRGFQRGCLMTAQTHIRDIAPI